MERPSRRFRSARRIRVVESRFATECYDLQIGQLTDVLRRVPEIVSWRSELKNPVSPKTDAVITSRPAFSLGWRHSPSDRPRPDSHSPLVEPSLNPAIRSRQTEGPVSPAWLSGGRSVCRRVALLTLRQAARRGPLLVQLVPSARDAEDDTGRCCGIGAREVDARTAVERIGEGGGMTDKLDGKRWRADSLGFFPDSLSVPLRALIWAGHMEGWNEIRLPLLGVASFIGRFSGLPNTIDKLPSYPLVYRSLPPRK